MLLLALSECSGRWHAAFCAPHLASTTIILPAAGVAIERGYDFYFWGHSDVALLAASNNSSYGADALECVAAAYANAPDWGILYFAYDWFSAIRTDLVRQVILSLRSSSLLPATYLDINGPIGQL